jgi:hypothetical protein
MYNTVLRIWIRDPVPFDPWTRIRNPGFRITNPYFLELSDKFLGKKFFNSLKTGPNFFLQHFKNKIIFNFVKFCGYKKRCDNKFFSPLSFVKVFGSGIRNPGSGMGKKSGSRIRDKHPGSATLVQYLHV